MNEVTVKQDVPSTSWEATSPVVGAALSHDVIPIVAPTPIKLQSPVNLHVVDPGVSVPSPGIQMPQTPQVSA